MKRRIAAPHERCERAVGQEAIWKARRLGRPVETQCSRKRLAGSPFCLWHQSNRVATRQVLATATVLAFLAARAKLIRQYGVPGDAASWWGWAMCTALGLPTQKALAASFGIPEGVASTILSFKTHRRLPIPPHKPGATWSDAAVIAVVRSVASEQGTFPSQRDYRLLHASIPSLPSDSVLKRFCGGGWATLAAMAAVPVAPCIRHYTDDERAFIEDHAGFLPTAEIARRLGRSHASIRIYMSRNGISPYREAGYLTTREAAREYHISHTTLRRVVNLGAIPSTEGRRGVQQRLVFLDPLDIEAWLERRRGGLFLAGGSE